MNSKRIIVLVGPSGSGKTTIGEKLSEKGLHKLVTTTTRVPRAGETDGVDYYFRNVDELDPKDFIEQTIYNHRLYGLTKSEVSQALDRYPLVHVSLDKNGARAMKQAFPEETLIIFLTVSAEDMKKRMECRGDAPQKIIERLTFSEETDELKPLDEADVILENRTVEETVESIFSVIDGSRQADISANGA
ncbi:Guanylate kinase [Alkalibacterium sp. AK22]|uniref:guanylate kinase n=1 Tax=Alkalibacterium sp. AK22 TaxID=1229520 RepID=UPI000450A1AC|nr:AAA family ATPase [Alkalibacterium sp. AK22]EXJ23996.1 Guanylate kinase [Alkalibacterium sp. AK22]